MNRIFIVYVHANQYLAHISNIIAIYIKVLRKPRHPNW